MNNIEIINKFLKDNTKSIILMSKISEPINLFYELLVQYFAKKNNFLFQIIDSNQKIELTNEPSLFNDKCMYICKFVNLKSAKDGLIKIKDSPNKYFVFVDYGYYKKNLNKFYQINTYGYKKDMDFFLTHLGNVESWSHDKKKAFLNFSYNNAHLFFTELDKSKVNNIDFLSSEFDSDTIQSIRKKIFKYKQEYLNKSLPKLYGLIKKEAIIKKFSFLFS